MALECLAFEMRTASSIEDNLFGLQRTNSTTLKSYVEVLILKILSTMADEWNALRISRCGSISLVVRSLRCGSGEHSRTISVALPQLLALVEAVYSSYL